MQASVAEKRKALEAQMAELKGALVEDEAAKDVAGQVVTAQAGKGCGKGVPEGGVAIRGLPQEKAMKRGVPDGDVAFRRSTDGKPKTAAEEKAAKQEQQNRYKRHCSTAN